MRDAYELCLFIGGIADGEWNLIEDIENRQEYNIIYKSPVVPWDVPAPVGTRLASGMLNSTTYRREQLTCGGVRWHVFVDPTLTLDAAMDRLLSYYKPPRKET